MAADRIEVDYGQLQELANTFQVNAESLQTMQNRINSGMNQLVGDRWTGEGASRFFAEMDAEVLPALGRLKDTLFESEETLQQIALIFSQAEENGSAPFTKDSGGKDYIVRITEKSFKFPYTSSEYFQTGVGTILELGGLVVKEGSQAAHALPVVGFLVGTGMDIAFGEDPDINRQSWQCSDWQWSWIDTAIGKGFGR